MELKDSYLGKVDLEDIKDGKFEIAEWIEEIGFQAFEGCDSLIRTIMPNNVKNIYYGAFSNCTNLSEIIFSENLIRIDNNAFEGCKSLKNIRLPESLQDLELCVFKNCSNLESINIPKNIKKIGDERLEDSGTFIGCSHLKDIELHEGLEIIGNSAFDGCNSLTSIDIPKSVRKIGKRAFRECRSLKNIKIPDGIEILKYGCFENCSSLNYIDIPKSVKEIEEECFKGCSSLKSITIPKSVEFIGDQAFKGCNSLEEINIEKGNENYISKDGILYWKHKDKNVLLRYPSGRKNTSFTVPEGIFGIDEEAFCDCNHLKEIKIPETVFVIDKTFDYNGILHDKEKKQIILRKTENLSSSNKYIPHTILAILSKKMKLVDFIENSDYTAFNSHIPQIKMLLSQYSEEEQVDFFKFAICLGCFSKKKILDSNLKETEVLVGQKASALLAKLMKNSELQLGNYHGLFNSLGLEKTASQEFLKFITPQGKKKENLELLLKLEREEYPGIFAKVMSEFDDAKKYRTTLAEDGTNKTISWKEALTKFYLKNKYIGVTESMQDIADVYCSKGLEQSVFEEGVKLRKKAESRGVPNHILGKDLRELSILEKIEQLKQKTAEELDESKHIIDDLYSKRFTFEWLDKNDPRNGILGLYVSCCGTITSTYYGKRIAKSSIIEEDVQNLVVRDAKGDIISKGTLYVNEKCGYGVFNDFELNEKYREHEYKDNGYGGTYLGDYEDESELSVSLRKQRLERDMIFAAFQRGIKAFAEEYDRKHPDNPLKQINVGMGYNRLKRNVEQFEETSNLLTVPTEYGFRDAENRQFILYKRDERKIEKQQEEKENIR